MHPSVWIYHIHVYTTSSDSTSPCQSHFPMGPLTIFILGTDVKTASIYILDKTLNYLLSSWIWYKTIPLCPTSDAFFWHSSIDPCDLCALWLHQNSLILFLSHFHPQYDNKLLTIVLTGCIPYCDCFFLICAFLAAFSYAINRIALSMALNYSFCPWYDDKLSLSVFVLTMAALTPVLP